MKKQENLTQNQTENETIEITKYDRAGGIPRKTLIQKLQIQWGIFFNVIKNKDIVFEFR